MRSRASGGGVADVGSIPSQGRRRRLRGCSARDREQRAARRYRGPAPSAMSRPFWGSRGALPRSARRASDLSLWRGEAPWAAAASGVAHRWLRPISTRAFFPLRDRDSRPLLVDAFWSSPETSFAPTVHGLEASTPRAGGAPPCGATISGPGLFLRAPVLSHVFPGRTSWTLVVSVGGSRSRLP